MPAKVLAPPPRDDPQPPGSEDDDVPEGDDDEGPEPEPDPVDPAETMRARVTTQARNGEFGKASQEFASNGVAPPSIEVASILRGQHPDAELPDLPAFVPGDQVSFKGRQGTKILQKLAPTDKSSRGVYGWSSSMLKLVVGAVKLPGSKPFLHLVGQLVARLASCTHAHPTTSFLLTAGELLALYKKNETERTRRRLQELPLLLRPVNVGSRLLVWAVKLALSHETVSRFKRGIALLQLGLGAMRGPEILAHFMWAMARSNHGILNLDNHNAFNEMCRTHMLHQVSLRVPSLTLLFITYYGIASPCFYFLEDGQATVIWSKCGARMGCGAGSLGYDAGAHSIYEAVDALQFDRAAGGAQCAIRAATDDSPIAVPGAAVPAPGDSLEEEQVVDFYEHALAALKAYTDAATPTRLQFNLSKCEFLVPDHIPDPPANLRFPCKIVRGSTCLVGAPVSTTGNDHCVHHFLDKMEAQLADKLDNMAGLHPQIAIGLLAKSFIPALFYYFQIIPPHLSMDHAIKMDKLFKEALRQAITPDNHQQPPSCSQQRLAVSDLLAELPCRMNGLGMTSLALYAKTAYWSSLATCVFLDEPLQRACSALEDFAAQAHGILHHQLTEHVVLSELTDKLFPTADPLAILRPDGFYEETLKKKTSLQKSLSQLTKRTQQHQVFNLMNSGAAGARWNRSPDVIAVFTNEEQRRSTSVHLSLSSPSNCWSPEEFISYVRFVLILPQLPHLGNAQPRAHYDYQVETCLNARHNKSQTDLQGDKQVIDLHGGHARSNCPQCKHGTHFAHNALKECLHDAGNMAGLEHPNEPTHQALLRRVGEDGISKLLPKHVTKASVKASCDLLDKYFEIDQMPLGAPRSAAEGALDRKLAALNAPASGMRLDVHLRDPAIVDTITPLLVDVATSHPFAAKNLPAEIKAARARCNALSRDPLEPLKGRLRKSPALDTAYARKRLRYKPLLHAIDKEKKAGLRAGPSPKMTPLIVSTTGHVVGFGPVKDMLERAYLRRLRAQPPRDDGKSLEFLTAQFVRHLKARLISSVQRGLAKSMLSAGRLYSPRHGEEAAASVA